MSKFLEKILEKSINFYIEKNLDDFYTKSSYHPNLVSHIEDKISWVISKKADWPMAIFRVNFENLNLKSEILKIKDLIGKGMAPNGWTVGPLTKPDDLGINLEKNGFLNVYQQAGMAVELKDLKNIAINENELNIKKIDDKNDLKQWIKVVSSTFGIKIDPALIESLFLEREAGFFLGIFKGKPISALMLYLSSGVAGLHAVSTLLEYRNKGFGLAISKTALIYAFKLGFRVGVLQASSMGERVYRKLGFKKYCDIISYELTI
ncbi:MAG: GNAT family N-acetyltransferase [Candidatus Hermodarchaeota archaeon]